MLRHGGAAALARACEWIGPDDFYRESHRRIFRAALALRDRDAPIDPITVCDELEVRGDLEEAGGRARVRELAHLAVSATNVATYARIVRMHAERRALITLGGQLSRAGWEGVGDLEGVEQLRARARDVLDGACEPRSRGSVDQLEIVSLNEFVSVDEPGAEALLGDAGAALIPENSAVMTYGDGGAGKTTLMIDMGFHLAAGDDWLGVRVARPVRVLFVENEGPRPLFRQKLRRKRESWAGSPVADRIHILQAPWAQLSFADANARTILAAALRAHEIDVVIIGPLTRSGMNDAGTLQEVSAFMALVDETRRLAGRSVTFVLVHHENKGGKVSGAWEGSGDTLLHVQGQGHGRTRLYVQKARWGSDHHGKTFNLVWTDGAGFRVDDSPQLDDEAIADKILDCVTAKPGTGWTDVEKATPGVARERRKAVRDGLLAAGRIVNVVKEDGRERVIGHVPERRAAHLYRGDDPTIAHLRRDPGADAAQAAPLWGENAQEPSAPCAPPYKGRRRSGADSPPSNHTLGGGPTAGEVEAAEWPRTHEEAPR
jgi:hypothetical protein